MTSSATGPGTRRGDGGRHPRTRLAVAAQAGDAPEIRPGGRARIDGRRRAVLFDQQIAEGRVAAHLRAR